MANITISDLRPAGADLFSDSESYLDDLSEGQISSTHGGSSLFCTGIIVGITITIAVGKIR